MEISNRILSDLTVYMKYARFIPELSRRETWDELVTRNKEMHKKKYPQLASEIEEVYKMVYDKKVLPSMRSLQFGGKPIEISPNRIYNCFSRETRFVTSTGMKSFEDFIHGDTATVLTHRGNWKNGVVRMYGKQKLNRIVLKRGRSEKVVFATENHRWLLYDGSDTTTLSVGDVLAPSPKIDAFDYDSATPLERLYWCYGYVYGDGTVCKDRNKNPRWSMVRLCGADKNKYLYRFEEMGFKTSSSSSLNGDVMVYTGAYLKTSPNLETDDISLIRAFVDGYLVADAYKNPDWYSNNALCRYKSILSSNDEHIDFLNRALCLAGYYVTRTIDLTGNVTNFGTRPHTESFSITNFIGSRPNTAWSVSSIEDTDRYEDVWCLEVEDDHSFILDGGIVTGNCAYAPIDDWRVFGEIMFLLLGGTGVGYSVQKHHVEKLPEIRKPRADKERRFLVSDSIEGWADAIKMLIKSYFHGGSSLRFDYSDIRPKGARLITSGGKAPGPEPLRICVEKVRSLLDTKRDGDKLSPIEVHDIVCHIADAVLAGGIRRAALISLFSADDDEMISSKFGDWWELNPQRGRANNSAVLLRSKVTEEFFKNLWKKIEYSNAGEPGIYLSNDKDWGTNPCCEIALRPFQFCNLCEVNVSDVETQEELETRVKAATFIGTLQAGYTDFHYLRPVWQRTTEKDALLGVGMTGIGSGRVMKLDVKAAAKVAKEENERVSGILGIGKAARITTIKPAGTSSLTLGCSSGIHAWHNDYYLRRIRVGKNEAIYHHLAINHPELVEDDYFRPHDTAIIGVPQKAPDHSILRTESPLQLLERVKWFNQNWIRHGHRSGMNSHNISATVSIREHEWDAVGTWLWENKEFYNGLSVLNYDGGNYTQAPFQDITKEKYEQLMSTLKDVDLTKIVEFDDMTEHSQEAACAGGACLI